MKTKTQTITKSARNDTVVPNLTIAAPTPAVHPLRLRNLARQWWVREKAIKRLEKQVDAIKAELKPLLPLGETLAGQFKIVKSHVDATPIEAFVRAGYDAVKVSEV
jgi:hypothetical protein